MTDYWSTDDGLTTMEVIEAMDGGVEIAVHVPTESLGLCLDRAEVAALAEFLRRYITQQRKDTT